MHFQILYMIGNIEQLSRNVGQMSDAMWQVPQQSSKVKAIKLALDFDMNQRRTCQVESGIDLHHDLPEVHTLTAEGSTMYPQLLL